MIFSFFINRHYTLRVHSYGYIAWSTLSVFLSKGETRGMAVGGSGGMVGLAGLVYTRRAMEWGLCKLILR